MMHLSYDDAARRVTNPQPCGASLRAECPICRHRSALSLREFPDGNAALTCHRCNAPIADLVRALRNGEASERPAPKLHIVPPEQKFDRIRRIWRSSIPPQGTMVESYLRSTRGITIPLGPAIRFNPRAFHPNLKINLPAMIAAVTDITGQGRALHFTWLRRDGDRVVQIEGDSKTMLGPVAGHAVRFPGAITDRILLAEGIETAARSRQRMLAGGYDWTCWACLSWSGIENCVIPAGTREVFIAADHDANGVGERAAVKKVEELRARGIEANWRMPAQVGKDYAD
jgi:hypothetical protein